MNLALFDFDGTITEGDTFSPFLRFALGAHSVASATGRYRVVVSAALDAYLAPWCEAKGLHCICTELEERDGRLTGRYRLGDCSGSRKVQRIRERYDLSRFPVIYGYGDTSEDQQMLELAHRKYYRWADVSETSAIAKER